MSEYIDPSEIEAIRRFNPEIADELEEDNDKKIQDGLNKALRHLLGREQE